MSFQRQLGHWKAGETTATHKQVATPAVAVRVPTTHPKRVEGVVGAGDQAATTVPKLDMSTAGAEVVGVAVTAARAEASAMAEGGGSPPREPPWKL